MSTCVLSACVRDRFILFSHRRGSPSLMKFFRLTMQVPPYGPKICSRSLKILTNHQTRRPVWTERGQKKAPREARMVRLRRPTSERISRSAMAKGRRVEVVTRARSEWRGERRRRVALVNWPEQHRLALRDLPRRSGRRFLSIWMIWIAIAKRKRIATRLTFMFHHVRVGG